MNQYICISHLPWSKSPSRIQHLLLRLKEAKILFFEPAENSKGHYRKPGRKVRPEVTVHTMPPLFPFTEKHGYLFDRQQRRLADYIAGIAARNRFRNPVLWCTSPEQVHLIDDIPHGRLIYDCCQDWSRLPPSWESELALAADIIFAASPWLVEHLSPCSDNIALLPNGADYEAFSKPNLPLPAELSDITGPIFGFVGTISRDLHLLPVLHAARDLPGCTFVLLGDIEGNSLLRHLRHLPNVRVIGRRSILEIPDYVAHFSVCMNLLYRNDPDNDIIPSRIYEYLSTGNPVVSMLFPDQIEVFPDVVYSAHTPEEFVRLCGTALQETGSWARERRREYGATAAWSQRAEQAKDILSSIALY
ncbi:MAG: hypothetical protein LIO58_03670 [Oscillospiraceae bacterium]|nr:hypothetical protein [Oscillospiraceae bacterium]